MKSMDTRERTFSMRQLFNAKKNSKAKSPVTDTANPDSLNLTRLRILSLLFSGFPFPPEPDISLVSFKLVFFRYPLSLWDGKRYCKSKPSYPRTQPNH